MMVMIILDTFAKQDGIVITASLELRKKVFITTIAGLLFVILAFLLVDKMGILGLCISFLISRYFLFIGQRKILRSKIQTSSVTPILKNVQPLLIAAIMLISAGYLSTYIQPVGLLYMMILIPFTFILSFFIFFVSGLRKENRNELVQTISSIKFLKSDK
jgi:hypothetical protein